MVRQLVIFRFHGNIFLDILRRNSGDGLLRTVALTTYLQSFRSIIIDIAMPGFRYYVVNVSVGAGQTIVSICSVYYTKYGFVLCGQSASQTNKKPVS